MKPHNWRSTIARSNGYGEAKCRRQGCKARAVMRDWKWRQTAGTKECND